MKQITLREFQRNASKYLTELPIMLTNKGKNIAVVQSVDTFVDKLHKLVDKPQESVDKYVFVPGKVELPEKQEVSRTPLGPRPSTRSIPIQCPQCHVMVWKENANQHYMENHEV